MKYKLYIVSAIAALIISIPVYMVLDNQHDLLKIERSQNHELQLKIEREQKAKTQTEQELQKEQDINQQIKQENEKLKAELQAKLKRQEQERLAQARAEQARKQQVTTPAVSVSRAGGGNCETYRGLVSQYDWDVDTMMRIMAAESSCNPVNHNHQDNHGVCMGSYGLFQIGCVHGLDIDYLSQAENNIASAYNIYKRQGYTAWSTF